MKASLSGNFLVLINYTKTLVDLSPDNFFNM